MEGSEEEQRGFSCRGMVAVIVDYKKIKSTQRFLLN